LVMELQYWNLLSQDIQDHFIAFIQDDLKTCLRLGLTCKNLYERIFKPEKWETLDFYDLDVEFFNELAPVIGQYCQYLRLGYIPDDLGKQMILNISLQHCKSLRTLIFKHLKSTNQFWSIELPTKLLNLSSVEIHSPPHSNALDVAPVILGSFPKVDHLIISLNSNYLHTQYRPETIRRVIQFLEEKLSTITPENHELAFQSWVTLQYLYRKLGDEESAGRVIQQWGPTYPRIDRLKFMTDRVLSGKCTRPDDTDTCFFWNHCFTCKLTGWSGLCGACATGGCHAGHKTMFKYISTGAYCDCTTCTKNRT